MSSKWNEPSIYLVAWDNGVVKAGYTSNRRYRAFEIRGAWVVRVEIFPDHTSAFQREDELHAFLGAQYPRAFASRHEAVPYLGYSGGGWTECYDTGGDATWLEITRA